MRNNPDVTIRQLAAMFDVTARTIDRSIAELHRAGVLRRIGGKKGGKWEVFSNRVNIFSKLKILPINFANAVGEIGSESSKRHAA